MIKKVVTYKGEKYYVVVADDVTIGISKTRFLDLDDDYIFRNNNDDIYIGCIQQGDTLKERIINSVILFATGYSKDELEQIQEVQDWDGNMDAKTITLDSLVVRMDKLEDELRMLQPNKEDRLKIINGNPWIDDAIKKVLNYVPFDTKYPITVMNFTLDSIYFSSNNMDFEIKLSHMYDNLANNITTCHWDLYKQIDSIRRECISRGTIDLPQI